MRAGQVRANSSAPVYSGRTGEDTAFLSKPTDALGRGPFHAQFASCRTFNTAGLQALLQE
jgi:hypothetical protein